MADEDDGGAREVYVDSDSGDDFLGFEPAETDETASNFDRLPQRSDRSFEADSDLSDSDSRESDSTVVYSYTSTLPSSSSDDVDISNDDDYTPRRRKLPRRGRGPRGGAQGGARIPAGPDGDAGGSGRGRARRGRRGGRPGDGRGDAEGRQAVNPTLPDGTEVLWQADNGMQPDWLQDLADATGKPTFDATDFRPVDYFERTFPTDFLESLCVETNRYYAEWAQNPNANEQIKKAFTDVDIAEMKAFIAILIMMGLSRRRSYKSHWSTHWLLDMPGLRSVMTRDRFFAILLFLHVADNSVAIARGEPGHDRAYKIRPMIRSLVAAWQAAYSIEKAVSIDECMIAFKGHVFMLQYMPKKPNKWGLKGWVMAGSETGYAYNWALYTGKEEGGAEATGLGQRVVVGLTDCLPAGHAVFYDNFFSSVTLTKALEDKGLGSCGTVRANRRGLPPQLQQFAKTKQKAALQRQSPLFLRSDNMLAVGWYDKRPVCLLTNIHSSEMIVKQQRDRAGQHGQREVHKPAAIEAYNQNMGGVDRNDQLNSYHVLAKKSFKWWKKVFFHLLLTAITNAHILHRSSAVVKLSSSDFRLQLAEQLLEGYERRSVMKGRPSTADDTPLRLSGRHFLEHCGKSTPECVVCTKRQDGKCVRRKRTSFRCKTCVQPVALCAVPCFEIYHTKRDFRGYYEQQL